MLKVNKKIRLAVIGLGYVGLPLALEFAKKRSVIGFDIVN
jgi:UDP-N-acetyl-D-galactosamine dehydrogenase